MTIHEELGGPEGVAATGGNLVHTRQHGRLDEDSGTAATEADGNFHSRGGERDGGKPAFELLRYGGAASACIRELPLSN